MDEVNIMNTTEMKRISLNIAPQVYEQLEGLANKRGKTVTGVIRDALALEAWFDRTREEGGRVLLDCNGEVREIVPR